MGRSVGKDNDVSPKEQAEPRFRAWDYAAWVVLTIVHLGVIVVGMRCMRSGIGGGRPHVLVVVLAVSLLLEFLLWEWRWLSLPLMRVPRREPARDGWRVAAAITFVPGV